MIIFSKEIAKGRHVDVKWECLVSKSLELAEDIKDNVISSQLF